MAQIGVGIWESDIQIELTFFLKKKKNGAASNSKQMSTSTAPLPGVQLVIPKIRYSEGSNTP